MKRGNSVNRKNLLYKINQNLKRTVDLFVSALSLLFLSPFLLTISILVQLDSPGKAIYRHRRIGKDGRPFNMYKFRSMRNDNNDASYKDYLLRLIESEKEGKDGMPYRKLENDPRITRVGKVLRRYYLDELPQLINVMRGDMSLVGPRPHVQLEVDHYSPAQRRRLSVRPGLTGMWQAEAKTKCSFSELIQMDLDYIDHWYFWLDFKIIFKTLIALFRGGEQFFINKGKSNQPTSIQMTVTDGESSSIEGI
jgi:lipopolysaccharide/colanic/teichoic acid biosynthesis glycosyltransferase